jgi:hypothetical protein
MFVNVTGSERYLSAWISRGAAGGVHRTRSAVTGSGFAFDPIGASVCWASNHARFSRRPHPAATIAMAATAMNRFRTPKSLPGSRRSGVEAVHAGALEPQQLQRFP